MGFTRALVPPEPGPVPAGIRAVEVGDVAAALDAARRPAPVVSLR
jgi:DNA repair protein RadA/Sms